MSASASLQPETEKMLKLFLEENRSVKKKRADDKLYPGITNYAECSKMKIDLHYNTTRNVKIKPISGPENIRPTVDSDF